VDRLTAGTGLWIAEEPMFQAWEQERAPILWIFGKPGSGKSFLAARTIEILKSKYPQHPEHPSLTSVSYVYIKDDNPDLQDLNQLLKTIAAQIARVNPRYQRFAARAIRDSDAVASASRTWDNLFLRFFTEDTPADVATSLAYVIVDGLDETPERERARLFQCLKKLVEQTTLKRRCRCQIAVFARPEVRGDPGFENIGFQRQEKIITVTPDRNQEDIKAYVRQRLEEIIVLKKLKTNTSKAGVKRYRTVAKQINESIQSRSRGMFLWAKLVFDQIHNLPSPEAVSEALERTPTGLDDMIHHVFQRLGLEERTGPAYLSELLKWVTCAYRPFSIAELYVILLVTTNQHCYVIEDDLRGKYSSLFELISPPDSNGVEGEEPVGSEEGGGEAATSGDFSFLDAPDTTDGGDESEPEEEDWKEIEPGGQASSNTSADDSEEEEGESGNFHEADNPRWPGTMVMFSHARIRDYLIAEGSPSTRRWQDSALGIDDLNSTKLRIALACMRILRSDLAERNETWTLKDYAREHFMEHLAGVDLSDISRDERIEAARSLYELFHEGELLMEASYTFTDDEEGSATRFMQTWFATNKYSNIVRGIFEKAVSAFGEDERAWVKEAVLSAKALFKPLAMACARAWLTKTGWDDEGYLDKSERKASILYAYHKLVSASSVETPVGPRRLWLSIAGRRRRK
jgi:hypothetical protein